MLHNTRHRPLPRKPKTTRLEKRRRVTLIAAFRCYEGAVLCADTMETVEGFRTPVHKLEAKECGDYWMAIAGSGNSDLIDGFAYRLELDVATWDPKLDDNVVGENIRNVLIDFYENDVRLYPSDVRDETRNNFLVCIKPKNQTGLSLWELRGSTIKPAGDYSLMGIGATMYMHELRTLYQANNGIVAGKTTSRFNRVRALLLGIHLFNLAKDTSTYIGGATDAIYVSDDGDMSPVDPDDVRLLEERVSKFDATVAEIVLACPDTTVQDVELASYLDNFTKTIMDLRKSFALGAADFSARAILRGSNVDPYLHIPNDCAMQFHFDTNSVTIEPRDENNPSPFKRKKPGRAKRIAQQR